MSRLIKLHGQSFLKLKCLPIFPVLTFKRPFVSFPQSPFPFFLFFFLSQCLTKQKRLSSSLTSLFSDRILCSTTNHTHFKFLSSSQSLYPTYKSRFLFGLTLGTMSFLPTNLSQIPICSFKPNYNITANALKNMTTTTMKMTCKFSLQR